VAQQARQQRIHTATHLIEAAQRSHRALARLARFIAVGLNQLQVGVAARLGGLQEHDGEYNALVAHCHYACN